MDSPNQDHRGRARIALLAAGGVLAGGAVLGAGGVLAGGAVLGAVGVAAANAAPVLTAATPSASASTSESGSADATTHGPGETLVTGSKADTLKAAALKAVPGGSVVRIETDSGDAAYEVHMTKSDGTKVTVKFDSNLTETAVEAGMGKGGGHGGNDHDAEDSTTTG